MRRAFTSLAAIVSLIIPTKTPTERASKRVVRKEISRFRIKDIGEETQDIRLEPNGFLPEWNYEIRPHEKLSL